MTTAARIGTDRLLQDRTTVVRVTARFGGQVGWLCPATGQTGTTPACVFDKITTPTK